MAVTQVKDINKTTIMDMLRTDVFGFTTEDIEESAKEAYNLVVNGDNGVGAPKLRMIAGYGRNETGHIVLFQSQNKIPEKLAKPKKK
jgi:ABC-type transport system involved in cytochrome c biogenesis ATPase subunit